MKELRPLFLLYVGFALVALVPASTIALAQSDQPSNPFLPILPALRTAPAPDWVKQGVRLTYYSAMATVVGGEERYDPDPGCTPRDMDCTRDPNTDKWYRRKPVAGAGRVSGHGYTQVNVVLLDRTSAVLDIRSYGFAFGNGPPVILSHAGAVGLPGAGGDFWLNPQVLREALRLRAAGLQVWQIPYDLGGTRFSAIRISSGSTSWVYDEATGVLLFGDLGSKLPDITGWTPEGANRQGSKILAQTRLVGVRQMNLPWAFGAAPDWVHQISLFQYQGKYGVSVPGSPWMPADLSISLERQGIGTNWGRYTQTVAVVVQRDLPPVSSQGPRIFGPAQLGGLWIPIRELRQLQAGQIVDRDPLTGVVAFVGSVRANSQGAEIVGITELSDGNRIDYAYDRNTGMLVFHNQIDKALKTQAQVQLVYLR